MDIQEGSDVYQVALEVRQWLNYYANQPCLLLASGGSSAHVLTRAWAQLTPLEQQHITVTLADERFGPIGHPDSNWRLLQELGMHLDDARHIPVLHGSATKEEDAALWQQRIQPYFSATSPIIAMLGMGEDSHIAGIKPHSPAASDTTHLAVAYDWEDYQRITISPAAFKRIDSIVLYVSGDAKRRAIEALKHEYDPVNYPSQYIKSVESRHIYYQP